MRRLARVLRYCDLVWVSAPLQRASPASRSSRARMCWGVKLRRFGPYGDSRTNLLLRAGRQPDNSRIVDCGRCESQTGEVEFSADFVAFWPKDRTGPTARCCWKSQSRRPHLIPWWMARCRSTHDAAMAWLLARVSPSSSVGGSGTARAGQPETLCPIRRRAVGGSPGLCGAT